MLMNKSLLFYILSMVGRQQAKNGRKDNISIPQITIPSSRRAKHSQHCHGLAPAPLAPGCSHQTWPHETCPGKWQHWYERCFPSKNPPTTFSFHLFLAASPCFPHSVCPSPLDKHQIANNVAVKQGYGPKP